jgi:hypothetical protein
VESKQDTPVGTTLARIEQGMVAFSAIHSRLHRSMDRFLKILNRINRVYLRDDDVVRLMGEAMVTVDDFDTASDVIPVSDPNIFCEVQRYGQIQAVTQRAQALAQIPGAQVYDIRKVEELLLKQMKLPNDGKDLLIPKPSPQQMNPVNENVALSLGRPIVAFPQQDHEAHISAHCDFYENPMFQMVCGQSPQAVGSLLQNLKEHVIFWYASSVHEMASRHATAAAKEKDPKAGNVDVGDMPQHSDEDPQVGQFYDRMLAAASVQVMQVAKESKPLQRATQTIQQLQQVLQQISQPQFEDPAVAAHAETQRKAQNDKMVDARENKKIQQAASTAQMQEQEETKRRQLTDATKQQVTGQDNQTAIQIESMKQQGAQALQQQDHTHDAMQSAQQQAHDASQQQAQQAHDAQQTQTEQAHDAGMADQQQSADLASQKMSQKHEASQAAKQQKHDASQASSQRKFDKSESTAQRKHEVAQSASTNVTDGESVGKGKPGKK